MTTSNLRSAGPIGLHGADWTDRTDWTKPAGVSGWGGTFGRDRCFFSIETTAALIERDVSTTELRLSPYLRDPDVQLMLRVKGGDDSAFAELVAAYQDRLVGLFVHVLQDREQAEDLAQEVFLRVYRTRETYQPTARFSTWLFRIANNLASNTRRSKHRQREVSLNVRDSGPLGPRAQERLLAEKSAFMPTRQFDKSETRSVVQEALESLSDRQRMALLLHKFEEMSYADIAAAMDLTPTAVKSLLCRARETLRQRLEKYVE